MLIHHDHAAVLIEKTSQFVRHNVLFTSRDVTGRDTRIWIEKQVAQVLDFIEVPLPIGKPGRVVQHLMPMNSQQARKQLKVFIPP
jgi:hypothetical protein